MINFKKYLRIITIISKRIFPVYIVIFFLIVYKCNLNNFEDLKKLEIRYINSIEISFGDLEIKRYRLSTNNDNLLNTIYILISNERNSTLKKERKGYYYFMIFNIYYDNNKKAKLVFNKDIDNDFYFFSYSSKFGSSVGDISCKDENGDFQKLVDYITEYGIEIKN